jgi:hypothetical protein
MKNCVEHHRGRECGKPATHQVGTLMDYDGFPVCEEHSRRYAKDFYVITELKGRKVTK